MAQMIITELGADTSALDKAIEESKAAIDDLGKAALESSGFLGKGYNTAASRVKEMGEAARKAHNDTAQAAKTAGDAAAKAGTQAKDAAKDVGEAGKKAAGTFNKLGQAAKQSAESVKGDMKGMVDGVGQEMEKVGGGFGRVAARALTAFGPVGLAIAALGGALAGIFANTDAGATYFDGIRRSGSIAFDKLTGVVTGFFDKATDSSTVLGKTFEILGKTIDVITTPLRVVVGLIGDLTGIAPALAEANAEGQRMAAMWDDIDTAQYGNIKNNAELERQVSALNIKLRDRTLTDQQRLDIAKQLTEVEQRRGAAEMRILKMTTEAWEAKAAQELRDKKEISDATARSLAEAQAAEIKADQASMELTDRAEVRANMIREQGAAREAAAREKRKAAAEKEAAERIKRAEQVAAAEATVAERIEAAKKAAARADMTPQQQQEADIAEGFDKEVQATQKAFDALLKLNAGNAAQQAAIQEQLASTLEQIERNKQGALEKVRDEAAEKQREEQAAGLDSIRKATEDETTLRREAVNKQFDELEAAARKYIDNEEQLTATLEALHKKREESLAAIRTDAQVKQEEDMKAAQERQVALIQSTSQALNGVLEQMAQGQLDTAEKMGQALVGITIDTVGKIIEAKILEIIAKSAAFGSEAGPVGAAIGIAGGTAIGAILRGLLNTLKSSIAGNYEGDPYVSGTPTWQGRDGYIRRLDYGERVVTRRDNEQHWDMLEAMRTGKLEGWLKEQRAPWEAALALNFTPLVNNYVDRGSVLPSGHDRRIVAASRDLEKQQRRTNELLKAMVPRRGPRPSRRIR